MNKKKTLIVCVLAALIASCSTLIVHKEVDKPWAVDKPRGVEKIKGIPFYIKQRIYEHETVWSSTVHEVTIKFSVTDASGDKSKSASGTIGHVSVPHSLYYDKKVLDLRNEISNVAPTSLAKFKNITDSFERIRQRIEVLQKASAAVIGDSGKYGLPKQSQLVLVSNKVNSRIEVDTGTKYYVNGKVPLFGTGTGNFDLATDMTLTSVESSVEDKTAETILAALPVTDFFTKQWALDTDADSEDKVSAMGMLGENNGLKALFDGLTSKSSALISIEFTSVPKTTFYHFRNIIAKQIDFGEPIDLEAALAKGSKVQIEAKRESTTSIGQADSKPTYRFSGEVVLPQAEKE